MWFSRAVFGPGPKPRQARDGHSWRMAIHCEWRPLLSFCQRALRLSSPPARGGVWKARVRLPGLSPVPAHSLLQCVGLRVGSFCPCGPLSPLPRAGGGWLICGVACRSRSVCARLVLCDPRGAPGASQDFEVPASERRWRFPFPLAPPVLGFACLRRAWLVPVVCRPSCGSVPAPLVRETR